MNLLDFVAQRRGRHEVGRTRLMEWVEVSKWGGRHPGWIPRYVLEGMGVDCSPLDRRETWLGKETQGTVWFTASQAKEIRNHSRWEDTDEPPKP